MLEFHDSSGRLIVLLRVGRNQFAVFVDGRYEAEFRSGREALEFAQALAENIQCTRLSDRNSMPETILDLKRFDLMYQYYDLTKFGLLD